MKTHNREFPCTVEGCNLAFPDDKDLRRRIGDCHIREPPKYICVYPGCKTKYGREGCNRLDNLRKHIRDVHRLGGEAVMGYVREQY